jgi:ABC-2 type transport system ATP-binding protein
VNGESVEYAVEVKGLCKTFLSGFFRRRRKDALRDVNLRIPEGSFWGILGPNGAGKTTLLSILSTLLTPDQGEVHILGNQLPTNAREICERINLSSGNANFLWSLSVRENLEYYAMLYGLSGRKRRLKVDELLEMFGLNDFARVRFDELSTGTKQKLSLAKTLVNDPVLLFLDEPTVGLDPDAAHRIRESIRGFHEERRTTIVMSTHNMHEAETLCGHTVFLKDGAIVAWGSPEDLKRELRLGDTIQISFRGSLALRSLETIEGILHFQVGDSSCRIVVDNHRKRLPQIFDYFLSQNAHIYDLHIEESDLEDVFIAVTK